MPGVGFGLGPIRVRLTSPLPVALARLVAAEELVVVNGCVALPDTARAAEIGNPGLRADPRAREDHAVLRLENKLSGSSDSLLEFLLIHRAASSEVDDLAPQSIV